MIINQTNQTIILWQTVHNTRLVWSKLTTRIQNENDLGFYWCSIKPTESNSFILSTVLNVSLLEDIELQTCNCGDGPIVDSTLFSEFPCVNGTVSEVDAQSDICPQGNNKKTPLSTNVAKGVWTTVPAEIDIDIGSTTGEGTESWTSLPTELPSSTTQETTLEIMTKTTAAYEDITQATNAADPRDQLDTIIISFTVGKLPHPPPPKKFVMNECTCCFLFPYRYSYWCYIIPDHLTVSHNWNLSQKNIKDESKGSQATDRACYYNKHPSRGIQYDDKD